jgi:hypothetical protein
VIIPRLLVLHPLRDRPLFFLVPPQAEIGRAEEEERLVGSGSGVMQQPLLQGKGTAGVGAVGVDAAASAPETDRSSSFSATGGRPGNGRRAGEYDVYMAIQELVGRSQPRPHAQMVAG